MTLPRMAALAALIALQPLSAQAEDQIDQFFRQLDMNGDGYVDPEEFSMQKGAIFYALDKNKDLKIEQSETRLSPQQFRQYAGEDGYINGMELFQLPEAQFEAFDQNGDKKVSKEEFRSQVNRLRSGSEAAGR